MKKNNERITETYKWIIESCPHTQNVYKIDWNLLGENTTIKINNRHVYFTIFNFICVWDASHFDTDISVQNGSLGPGVGISSQSWPLMTSQPDVHCASSLVPGWICPFIVKKLIK